MCGCNNNTVIQQELFSRFLPSTYAVSTIMIVLYIFAVEYNVISVFKSPDVAYILALTWDQNACKFFTDLLSKSTAGDKYDNMSD